MNTHLLKLNDILKRYKTDLAALTFLCSLVIVVFWNPILDPLRTIQEDIALHCQGVHQTANEQISSGHFPHWNPYALSGIRLFADVHLALFYPGSILFRVLPFPTACMLTWLGHYAAVVCATYALCRIMLQLTPFASSIAAACFGLGGFSVGHCNHLNFVYAMPWFVLTPVTLHLLSTSDGSKAFLCWLAGVLCVTMMIVSGGTPILVLSCVLVCWLCSLILIREMADLKYRRCIVFLVSVITIYIAAIGLAAFQVLPTFDLYHLSHRSTWNSDQFQVGAMQWRTLLYQIVAPGSMGDLRIGSWHHLWHEYSVFVGGISLALALAFAPSAMRSKWLWAILALLICSTTLAMGDAKVISFFSSFVPLLRMRQCSRYVLLVQFAIALLAGIGADQWSKRQHAANWRIASVLAALVSIIMLAVTFNLRQWYGHMGDTPDQFHNWLAVQPSNIQPWMRDVPQATLAALREDRFCALSQVIWCSGGLAVCFASWIMARSRRVAMALVLLWMSTELSLFVVGTWAGRPRYSGISDQVPPIVKYLQDNSDGGRYFNAAVWPPLWENRGAVYGLSNADGYRGFALSKYMATVLDNLLGTSTHLGILSTKYLLFNETKAPGDLRQVFRDSGIAVCENPTTLPRAFLLQDVMSISDDATAIAVMRQPGFSPRHTAIIDTRFPVDVRSACISLGETVRVVEATPGHIELQVQSDGERWLLISEAYDPGWKANIDGHPAFPVRADICLMALRMNAGRHEICLDYSTPQLVPGVAVSLATVILIAFAACIVQFRQTLFSSADGARACAGPRSPRPGPKC